jgi:alkylation response protein AidB-like acyl-CoA dehydrogenase
MGFVEETGAAQYVRDVRVATIYEGTNGIQAMDLVARKLSDGGEAMNARWIGWPGKAI